VSDWELLDPGFLPGAVLSREHVFRGFLGSELKQDFPESMLFFGFTEALAEMKTTLEPPHITSLEYGTLKSCSSGVIEPRRSKLLCGKSSPERNPGLKRTR
jgi:hypothetical protein